MKRKFLIIPILLLAAFSSSVIAQTANSNGVFKSVDEEVGLEVHRSTGEVKLALQVKDITQYHYIVIERSAETPNYFAKCRYISCSEIKPVNGQIFELDKYPYSASIDVYYRVKTVSNDGVERAYPAVLLAAASQ